MKKYILGLHVSHDASACLISEGKLLLAVQEERLTREKFHDGFPREAVRYILEIAKINPADVAIAVAGELQHIENPSWVYLQNANKARPVAQAVAKVAARLAGRLGIESTKTLYFSESVYKEYVNDEVKSLGFDPATTPISFFDHHLCHAATAFFPSTYDKAIILTQDGRGDRLSGSVYLGTDGNMKLVHAQSADDSVAQLYAGVTKFLNFRPLRHEGKITGLAAFGKDTELRERIEGLFSIDDEGRITKTKIQDHEFSVDTLDLSNRERRILNAGPQEYRAFDQFSISFQHWLKKHADGMSREDVAYAIQSATENVMVRSVLALLEHLKISEPINIGVSGGLFANVKLNQRIRECSPLVNDVYVQPAMGDCGLSLGAGILLAQEQDASRVSPVTHVYTGNSYSPEEIETALKNSDYEFKFRRVDNIEEAVGRMINDGIIIGWFNGSMEFGPRALGSRSIVLHPGNPEVNKTVNDRLNRTEFMPFAPSVLDYRAKDYFIGYDPKHVTTDWMTITYDVFKERQREIAAVVHIDGTARPQIVKAESNPSYYRMLQEFEKLSGIGCVVNTSFNMHEEPIVASPEDALRAFDLGGVDVLVMGPYIVEKP